MRDNYFEKKLEITRDNLAWAIQETRNVEIQMERAKTIFDDKIKTGNEAIKRLESIQKKAEKDIKHYENMIEKGYKFVDIRNGKAYKTEANLQKQLLSEKTPRVDAPEDGFISEAVQEAEKEVELKLESKRAEKARVKADRKAREKASQEAIEKKKEAIRIKAEAEAHRKVQAARKLKEAEEKVRIAEEAKLEAERLAKEAEEAIVEEIIEEEPIAIDEVEEIIEDLKIEDIEDIPEVADTTAFYEDTVSDTLSTIEPTIVYTEDNELAKLKATRDQVKQVKEEMNNKISQEEKDKKWISESTQGQAQAKLYKEQEGGYAIWQGVVTKGFRTFCKENNLKIGD